MQHPLGLQRNERGKKLKTFFIASGLLVSIFLTCILNSFDAGLNNIECISMQKLGERKEIQFSIFRLSIFSRNCTQEKKSIKFLRTCHSYALFIDVKSQQNERKIEIEFHLNDIRIIK